LLALNLAVFLLGWLIAYPLTSTLGPWITICFAPVAGWLMAGLFTLAALWLGVGVSPPVLGILGVALTFALWKGLRTELPRNKDMVPFATGVATCLAVSIAAEWVDFYFWDSETIQYSLLGRWVGQAGSIEDALAVAFLDFGSLPIAWQSLSFFTKSDYLYAFSPMFAVSFIAAMTVLGNRLWASSSANRSTRLYGAALASAWVATAPVFLVQSQSIHPVLPATVFLLWFWASALLYFQERHGQWLALCFLSLTGFTFCQVEGALFAAVFLTVLYSDERISNRHFCRGFHPYSSLVFLYSLFLATRFAPHHEALMSPEKVAWMNAPLAVLFALSVGVSVAPKTFIIARKYLFQFAAVVCVVCIAVCAFANIQVFGASATHTFYNVIQTGGWGFTWIAAIAALIWMYSAHSPSWENLLWKALTGLALLLTVLVALRGPYQIGFEDPTNQLLLYAVPLVGFILMGRWVGLRAVKRD
jgi:hypothetical protein